MRGGGRGWLNVKPTLVFKRGHDKVQFVLLFLVEITSTLHFLLGMSVKVTPKPKSHPSLTPPCSYLPVLLPRPRCLNALTGSPPLFVLLGIPFSLHS
jgi:hypothetical protein